MQEIPLTQGKVALVDVSDYDFLSQWNWYALNSKSGFYAVRNSTRVKGKQYKIFMHRVILGLNHIDLREGDHIDHNTLNNSRDNLRICIHRQNMRNRKLSLNTTSKFKGVYWNKEKKKWHTDIRINGKKKYLGHFKVEINAALAYDKAALLEFGDFAHLNFPAFQRSLVC